MKRSTRLLPIIAVAGLAAVQTAHAVVFDFIDLTAELGEQGFEALEVTREDITVIATGHQTDYTPGFYAYLDGPSSGRPAGLGVCKTLDASSQCDPGNDDNLNSEELLRLTFDTEVTIEEILFRDAEHFPSFEDDADFLLSVDGGEFIEYPLVHIFTTELTGTIFDFIANGDGDELYISAMTVASVPIGPEIPVPEPATVSLLGLGLAALGWKSRQRKA